MPSPEDYRAMLEDGSKMIDSATKQIEIGQRMVRFAKLQLGDDESEDNATRNKRKSNLEKEGIILSLEKQLSAE